jgi:hypothetical protein
VRPEKNVAFNEAVFFDPQEFDEPKEDIIVTIKVPFLSTTPPSRFISEDLEESWVIGDTIEVLPPFLSEASKALFTPPSAPTLPTPRATESPDPAPAAGPAPAAEPAPQPAESAEPLKPSQEIFGDPKDSRNIVEGPRTRKPATKTSQSYALAFY